ncbi:HEPN domain-containing protein [Jidongwangia harbinensis]|uniref:HEPN domain-containing protein n=1 Tax=Jidongwangia harbinensis TaxID=2878561 RepID=UPI001CD95A51|nr:HEPN domain-containing protein [Jidongwangia harbinensis]MCA2212591.1 hypothetical protein [Jidongwangia harbinensis]
MTSEELGHSLDNSSSGSGIFRRWRGGTERHVLEVESTHTVEEHRLSEGGGLEPILLSFALHGYNIGTTFHATVESTPSWLLLGMRRAGPPVGLPELVRSESEKAITAAHLNSIDKLAASATIRNMAEAQDAGGFALRRFQLGVGRNNSSDALVDFVVSLESILLREQGDGEMAHRFRTNGAYLLGSSYEEREDISVRLNKVYGARSRFVHGPRPGGKKQQLSSAEIAALSTDARQLATEAILRGIDRGWPDAGDFRRMSLGG